jgi:GWxTD domain-containing protein
LGYLSFSKSSNKSFSFLFASKISNKEDFTIDPINNNLVFSAEKIKLYLFIPNSQNYNQIKYKISRLKENVDYWKEKVELNGKLENVSKIPSFRKSRENIISNSNLSENEISATSADYSATLEYYEINFAKNPFVPGIYEMQIYLSSKDTLSARFRVDWDNMPLTLTNMPIALKVSELFFNKSEMKKISDGNRVEQFIKLNGAWKNFNPNMDSKYNEAFEEYYRRADYAYFHFATFAQKNGAFTDKARIYILNGPPDEIKESFKNGKLFEKWTYRRVIKEYTFESVSAGVLKLVQIKE